MHVRKPAFHRPRERGIVLFISLIVLVALAIATIAIMRSVTGGLLVAGNLGFKRSATAGADFGVEQARSWVLDPAKNAGWDLTKNNAGAGYYAEFDVFADFMTAKWDDGNSRVVTGPNIDETIRYVLHRLCESEGASIPATCVMSDATSSGDSSKPAGYPGAPAGGSGTVYYRVTARIQGPKNTISFVQTSFY